MTHVINFSAEHSQLHSPVSLTGQSTCILDLSTTYKSFVGARVSSTPVTGKRISTQSTLSRPENDNSSKYPIPVQIFAKTNRKIDSKNNDNSNFSLTSRASKSELKPAERAVKKPPIHPSKVKMAKETQKMSKDLILSRQMHQSKSMKTMTEKKSLSKSFSITHIKTEEIKPQQFTESPKPRSVNRINDLVKQTLLKEKSKKVCQEKAEKVLKAQEERKRIELRIQNSQIRRENLIKYRQEKFKPKIAWGANEKRLGLDIKQLQREIEEQRQKKREYRERTKSVGKDRIGLELIEEINLELGQERGLRSKSASQEIVIPARLTRKPDPKIKKFIKVQKQTRKEIKETEMLSSQAEESKRLTQLKHLEVFNRFQCTKKKRRKSMKKRKKPKKWIETSPISVSEENPLRSQKFVYETEESKESESFIPAAYRGAREELKSDDSIRMYINQNQSGNINFQDDTNISEKKLVEFMHSEDSLNAQLQSHESKSSLEIRKNDIKQKISDLRSRIGNVKFNFKDDSFDIKTDAAIKIQTHFRRYLAQKKYFSDSFSDEDKEVQKILSKITKTSPKKPLEIEIGSNSFSDIPSENPIHILSPKLSTIGPKLLEELKHLEETKTKKHEFKDILKDQLVWQESQMQNLQWLKEKELKELQAVTENLGHGPELQSVLSQIIENRYLHLTNLLVENIENVQEALTGDSDSIQKVEIVNEFSGISSRKEESDQDSDRFLKKFKRGKFVDDINSESESILPEELEKIMHEMNQSENLKRIISEIEPANISVFEEEKQFSEVPSCVSGISGDNNEKPFYPDFDEIITDPDENEEFVHSIMLINESYKKFEADFLKNPNKDPEELISDFEQPNYKEFSDMELPSEDMIQELENAMNELINQTDPVLEINKRQPAKETSVEDPVTIDSPKIKAFSISPEPQIYKESRHRWNEILIEEGQSPEQTNFELKNEDSSILDDLQIPTPEPAVSITPENPFERPSAPIHGSDSEEEKISNDFFPKFGKDYDELKTSLAFTPELLTAISESILQQLLSEDLLPRPRDISFIEMLPKEPMIRTDSISVQMYIDEIFDSASDDFLKNLKKPIKRNPLEILSKMQETDIGSLVEFTGPSPILNVNLYLNLEHPRDVINSDRSLTPNSMRLIKEAEHIHNKMIFDAANESLQQYRTYGLKGIPMPWSYTDRQMMPLLKNPDVIIVEVKKEIKKWSSIQAGKIPSRDMMLSDGILDEEILQQAREERLAAMLAEDVMEKDEVWVEYEFEETQAKLDLADMVLEQLVVESINILEA